MVGLCLGKEENQALDEGGKAVQAVDRKEEGERKE